MSSPDQIWRKSVTLEWLRTNETRLLEVTRGALAIIERPGKKRILLECPGRNACLLREFGGKMEKVQSWKPPPMKPIRIGGRLIIRDGASDEVDALVIPAGAAFGTGEHATTAMSLRLLEQSTRGLTSGWRMLDAGTGSGILALAGKRFGAGRVVAIDHDPRAISTAKANARANRILGVRFVVADVRDISGLYEIITANLYSELLIAVLPRFRLSLKMDGLLILSGVLRAQEPEVVRALRKNALRVHEIRRRGKWIALRAGISGPVHATSS